MEVISHFSERLFVQFYSRSRARFSDQVRGVLCFILYFNPGAAEMANSALSNEHYFALRFALRSMGSCFDDDNDDEHNSPNVHTLYMQMYGN